MIARAGLAFVLALAAVAPAYAVEVKTVTAPSGMDVWLSEEHSLPVVAISVSLPAGSAYDPTSKEGLAAITAAQGSSFRIAKLGFTARSLQASNPAQYSSLAE